MKVGEKTPTQLGPLERANLNYWTSFRNVVIFGIQDDGKIPEKFCEFCTTYTIVKILSSLLTHCLLHAFFFDLLFNPEVGGDTFLPNFGELSTHYTT
jgi:hypothetical protein